MAITYNAGTNIITVTGYTEATPCNFTDIYNADVAGSWGKVTLQCTNQFCFAAAITIGDGSTTTWFADINKQIINTVLVDSSFIKVLANASFRSGELVNASKHITKSGCAFTCLLTATTRLINSVEPIYLYSSYFYCNANYSELICVDGSRLWNSIVAKNLYPKDAVIDIVNTISSCTIAGWAKVTSDNWIILDPTYGLIGAFADNFSIKNTKIIDATYDFYLNAIQVDCDAINVEAGWIFYWVGVSTAKVNRKYEFDMKVIDKDNTPIQTATVKIWDKDSNLIIDTTTDASGDITTQTISRGYYNQANGNTLQEYSPHLIKIEKAGYTTYEADFTLESKTDWLIALQAVGGLMRNPPMTGGMV